MGNYGLVQSASQSFTSVGQLSFTVPTNVSFISVTITGASGGPIVNGHQTVQGGFGSIIAANISVVAGETLYIYVGGQGSSESGGYNGGGNPGINGTGGGGATDIRRSPYGISNRIIAASGGGGLCRCSMDLENWTDKPDKFLGENAALINKKVEYYARRNSSSLDTEERSIWAGENVSFGYCGGGGGGGWFGGRAGQNSDGEGGSSYFAGSFISSTTATTAGNGQATISWIVGATLPNDYKLEDTAKEIEMNELTPPELTIEQVPFRQPTEQPLPRLGRKKDGIGILNTNCDSEAAGRKPSYNRPHHLTGGNLISRPNPEIGVHGHKSLLAVEPSHRPTRTPTTSPTYQFIDCREACAFINDGSAVAIAPNVIVSRIWLTTNFEMSFDVRIPSLANNGEVRNIIDLIDYGTEYTVVKIGITSTNNLHLTYNNVVYITAGAQLVPDFATDYTRVHFLYFSGTLRLWSDATPTTSFIPVNNQWDMGVDTCLVAVSTPYETTSGGFVKNFVFGGKLNHLYVFCCRCSKSETALYILFLMLCFANLINAIFVLPFFHCRSDAGADSSTFGGSIASPDCRSHFHAHTRSERKPHI